MNIANSTNHTILAHNTLQCLKSFARPDYGFNESLLSISPDTFTYLVSLCESLQDKFQLPKTETETSSLSYPSVVFNNLFQISGAVRHCLGLIAYQPRILDPDDAVRYIGIKEAEFCALIGLHPSRLAAFGQMLREFDETVTSITPEIAISCARAVVELEFMTIYSIILSQPAPEHPKQVVIINVDTFNDQREKYSGIRA